MREQRKEIPETDSTAAQSGHLRRQRGAGSIPLQATVERKESIYSRNKGRNTRKHTLRKYKRMQVQATHVSNK